MLTKCDECSVYFEKHSDSFCGTARCPHCLRRHIDMHQSEWDYVQNWFDAASQWTALHGDEREARHCLMRAEAVTQDDPSWWDDCAEKWVEMFNDRSAAARCAEAAEACAHEGDATDWEECASAWRHAGDRERARQCAEKAKQFGAY